MTTSASTRYLEEHEFDAWNHLVAQSPQGSVYSTPEYLEALCGAAGGRFRILGCFRGDELAGGVGLYMRQLGNASYVAPRLLLYYNGLVLRHFGSQQPYKQGARTIEIVSSIADFLGEDTFQQVVLHTRAPFTDARPFIARGWTVRPSYTYVVPTSDPAAILARMDQNLRRLVKRCEASGATFAADVDFDEFHVLHAETARRKSAPVYLPKDRFRSYFERLAAHGLARLYALALPGGEVVSAQLVLLGNHPVTHSVCAGASAAHLHLGTAVYLRYRVLAEMARAGYVANDLTDAALSEVTRFKAQLGGDLVMNLVVSKAPSPLAGASPSRPSPPAS